ncbi:hypothetical protein CAEBREN_04093 [Caenorhabditis brenneri]|uniref:3'-5' exonuclease domain-containing protein n=1 Tax=Caenorhabditis brenneri TaxID=135651 RepID=G0NI30_CAEBE|nr:hypothetical protein CAEBREN_04093 [Caenorhabditis brenneri]
MLPARPVRVRPNPVIGRHLHVRGIIKSHLTKEGKFLSPGTLLDLVRIGYEMGPYGAGMGARIRDMVQEWVERYREEHQFLLPLMTAVLEGGGNVDAEVIQELSDAGYNIPPRYNYPDLAEFKIHIENSLEKGLSYFSEYRKHREYPLYIDTENAHWLLPSGRNVALVTICDVKEKTILLLRTYGFSASELNKLEFELGELTSTTKIATFGRESVFSGLEENLINLQVNPKISLQTYAKGFGMTLKKSETLSDWCRQTLRHDQVQYAAMDALVLWKLQKDMDEFPKK